MKTTMFMLLNALPVWLAMSREDRRAFQADVLNPILAAHPKTTMRYYDTEAFSGRCSDIAVFETEDLQDYSDLVEALRDSPFFARPYYAVVDIIPGLENGYLDYDARVGVR